MSTSRRRAAESATGAPTTKPSAPKKANPAKKTAAPEKEQAVKQEPVVWRIPEVEAVVDRFRIASSEALRQRTEDPSVMKLPEDVPLTERVQAAQCPYLYFSHILKCLYSVHAEPLFVSETYIPKAVMDGLYDRAREDLKKSEVSTLSAEQVEHMTLLSLGNAPFGLKICEDDKMYQPETLPHNNAFDTMSNDLVLPRWRNRFTCFKVLEPTDMDATGSAGEAKTPEDEKINKMIESALRDGIDVGELQGTIPVGRTAQSKLKVEKTITALAASAATVIAQDMDEDEPVVNTAYILPPGKDEYDEEEMELKEEILF